MARKTTRRRSNRARRTGRAAPRKPRSDAAAPDGSRAEAGDEPTAGDEAPGADDVQPADLSALKDGKLYYRIGEVSQITGVKPYVLRYWESEFRLMAPQKSRSKQRLYRPKDIETILAIKRLLYQERYTIAGARKRLRELGGEARAELAATSGTSDDPRSEYRRIRDELLAIRALLTAEI